MASERDPIPCPVCREVIIGPLSAAVHLSDMHGLSMYGALARLARELEEAREVLHEIADRECSYQAGGAETCPSVLRPRYGVGGRARMCGPCLAEAFFATPPAEGGGDGG